MGTEPMDRTYCGVLGDQIEPAKTEAFGDAAREKFLGKLLTQLTAVQEGEPELPVLSQKLNQIIQSVQPEFQEDPVMDHLTAFLEELERIRND